MPFGVVRPVPAVLLMAVALGLLCGGMALAIAGVVVPGLFLPGVIAVALGMLSCAVAAVLPLFAKPDAGVAPAGQT